MEENHMGWKLVRGVRHDVTELFKLFANTNSVRYEDYCTVWKKMRFFTIFSCRNLYIERIEFIEELFHIVKGYLSSVYDFQNRIAALYTLYGLYFKQPLKEPVKIRLTKPEWNEVQTLIEVCKKEKHYDVVFIYLKMLLSSAFIFTLTERTVGLENGFRKYLRQRSCIIPSYFNVEILHKPLLNEKLVASMVKLEELYCKKREELLGRKNLNLVDTNFSLSLQSELKKYEATKRSIVESCIGKDESDITAKNISSSDDQNKVEVGNKFTSSKGEASKKRKNSNRKCLIAKRKAQLNLKYSEDMQQTDLPETSFELPDLS